MCIVTEGTSNVKKLFHIDLNNTLVAFQSEISKNTSLTRLVHVFSEQPSYMVFNVICEGVYYVRRT